MAIPDLALCECLWVLLHHPPSRTTVIAGTPSCNFSCSIAIFFYSWAASNIHFSISVLHTLLTTFSVCTNDLFVITKTPIVDICSLSGAYLPPVAIWAQTTAKLASYLQPPPTPVILRMSGMLLPFYNHCILHSGLRQGHCDKFHQLVRALHDK